MKAFILLATLVFSFTSPATTVQIVGGNQIRHGGYFAINPTFTSFKNEVQKELAQRIDVTFVETNAEIVVDYESHLSQDTFYSLNPQGTISAEILATKSYFRGFVTFACAFEVNDGGNVTLKRSCAKKLARKVAKTLHQFLRP